MKKLEKTGWVFIVIAMIGIIAMWVFACYDKMELAATSFVVAGTACFLGLISLGLNKLRNRI